MQCIRTKRAIKRQKIGNGNPEDFIGSWGYVGEFSAQTETELRTERPHKL